MHKDHSALRYLMAKKYMKPRLIRWVLLLQKFDFEVKDRLGTDNQVAHNFSRLEEDPMHELGEKAEIDDASPNEHVLAASQDLIPSFAEFANYLASDIVQSEFTFHQKKKVMYDVKKFFWDEPYLYRICANLIIRRYVLDVEILSVF